MSGEPSSLPFYLEPVNAEGGEGTNELDDLAAASTTNVITSSMIPIRASAQASPEKQGDTKALAKKRKEKIVKVKHVPPSEQRERSKSKLGVEGGTPASISRKGSMRFSTSGVYAFNVTPSQSRRGRSMSMVEVDQATTPGAMLSPTRSPFTSTFSNMDLQSPEVGTAPSPAFANTPSGMTPGDRMSVDGSWMPEDPVSVVLQETELFVQQCVHGGTGSPRQRAWSRTSAGGSAPGSPQSPAGSPAGRGSSGSSSPIGGTRPMNLPLPLPKRYGYQQIDMREEVDRYVVHGATGAEDEEGACGCDYSRITRDTRGFDYSRYQAHALYHQCTTCHRQPASFLCLHCLESVCPSHVEQHTNRNEEAKKKCTLYINIQEIATSYDRIFWCECCKRFTWKFTEEYEPFTDQIAVSKGTYLDAAVTDVWVKQYMTKINQKPEDEQKAIQARSNRRKSSVMHCIPEEGVLPAGLLMPTLEQPSPKNSEDSPAKRTLPSADTTLLAPPEMGGGKRGSGASDEFLVEKWNRRDGGAAYVQSTVRALGASMQGWRSGQEDAEAIFTVEVKLNRADARDALECSCSVFCVFDGHGGDAVAKIAARDIQKHLLSAFLEAPPLRHGGADEEYSTSVDVSQNPAEVFSATGDDADVIHEHFTTIFRTAFMSLDKEIQMSEEGLRGDFNTVGCTACCVAITEDFIICANLGDSGAVLFHPAEVKRRRLSMVEGGSSASPVTSPAPNHTAPPPGVGLSAFRLGSGSPDVQPQPVPASKESSRRPSVSIGGSHPHHANSTIAIVPLSQAHRLSDDTESNRVKAAGYSISDERIEGMLAVPRALGDFDFKMCGGKSQSEQAVSSCPDVMILPKKRRGKCSELVGEVLEEKDWTIIVACDGIWDTMPKEDVCRLAHQALYVNKLSDYSMGNVSSGGLKDNNSFASGFASARGGTVAVTCESSSTAGVPQATLAPPADLDTEMLQACNSIFDHVIAPSLNDLGLGMDNMSLLLMRPTTDELKEVRTELRRRSVTVEADDDSKSNLSL